MSSRMSPAGRPVRVLEVIGSLHIGGAEKVVVELATSLDPRRFSVEVLCTMDGGIHVERLVAAGIRTTIASGTRRASKVSALRTLARHIGEINPDLIHTHGTAALIHVGPLYWLKRLPPLVHTFHFGNYPHVKARYLWAERVFARRAHSLVAVSRTQRDAIIRHHRIGGDRIRTIVNGVEDNPFLESEPVRLGLRRELGIGEKHFLVGCVAVLSVQKGIEYLLEAAARIVNTSPHVRFVIVGGGPSEEALKQAARRLGVDGYVHFTGWRGDAMRLLPLFDLFVLPSLWEGFPVVLLEAMSAGRPIVTTSVGDNRSIIEDGHSGIIIPPKDAEAIVRAISRVIESPSLAQTLGVNALGRCQKHFTVRRMVEQYEELFFEVRRTSRQQDGSNRPRSGPDYLGH